MRGADMDERGLRRVAAMLVALAALAERASSRSFPIRWLVLSLLRYAERVARDLLVDETGWDRSDIEKAFDIGDAFDIGAGFDAGYGSRNGPADALVLAWRLRSLAALFGTLLPPADFPGRHDARAGADAGDLASHAARLLAMLGVRATHPAPDTS